MENSINYFVWQAVVEQFIYHWSIAFEAIGNVNLEGYKSKISDKDKSIADATPEERVSLAFEVISNPIEQLISEGLMLGFYGSFEKTLMELVQIIEDNTGKIFKSYCKSKRKQKNKRESKIVHMRNYIELNSNLKFENLLFSDILILNKIRNILIHNGGKLEKEDFHLINKIKKFSIVDEPLDGMIYLGEDIKHLLVAHKVTKDFLMNTLVQDMFR